MFISNKETVQISSVNFLGVLIDEHLTRKKRVAIIENEILKNLVILSSAKRLVFFEKYIFDFYKSSINSNYGNSEGQHSKIQKKVIAQRKAL